MELILDASLVWASMREISPERQAARTTRSTLDPLKARLRQLRRSPLQWYLHRLPFKEAISALEAGASRR
jgi:hypothetical protein